MKLNCWTCSDSGPIKTKSAISQPMSRLSHLPPPQNGDILLCHRCRRQEAWWVNQRATLPCYQHKFMMRDDNSAAGSHCSWWLLSSSSSSPSSCVVSFFTSLHSILLGAGWVGRRKEVTRQQEWKRFLSPYDVTQIQHVLVQSKVYRARTPKQRLCDSGVKICRWFM